MAFLGLGVMGFPMAGHLARAGHQVTVYNRTPAKAAKWVAAARRRAERRHAGRGRRRGRARDDVRRQRRRRARGRGGRGRRAGQHEPGHDPRRPHDGLGRGRARDPRGGGGGAASASSTRPVSGGQAGAENGKLTIMVGGDADVFARAESVLAYYARAVTLMGGPGSGQLTKMVNQICIAGLRAGAGRGDQLRARGRASTSSACST